jgi:hypothetical protein
MIRRNEQDLLDALMADPRHEWANLWFEGGPRARYATLSILFVVGIQVHVAIPLAKAFIIELLQEEWEHDQMEAKKPPTLIGRIRRGGLGEIYGVRHHLAEALAEDTVTHYMMIAQKEIRRGIEEVLGLPLPKNCPDFIFERGKPWGVCMRSPGVNVHRA